MKASVSKTRAALAVATILTLFCIGAIGSAGVAPADGPSPSAVRVYCSPLEKIIGTHAIGLCNLALFVTRERQTAKPFGVELDLKYIPNWGDHALELTAGHVDVTVTPFTNIIAARANGAPIKIIAGSGMNGLFVVSQAGIETWEQLKGRKLGTFRADTLEVVAHDAMRKAGLKPGDVEIVYFDDGFALMQAFASKQIDAMTHVEPYPTEAVRKYGGHILARGQDVWGGDHPDCVLTTSETVLHARRNALKAVIAGMLTSEVYIEEHFEDAIDLTLGKYYKADRDSMLMAGRAQPPMVDIRDKKDFILARSKSLQDLGYIDKPITGDIFDLSLLDEVIRENPALYGQVRVKAKLGN